MTDFTDTEQTESRVKKGADFILINFFTTESLEYNWVHDDLNFSLFKYHGGLCCAVFYKYAFRNLFKDNLELYPTSQ